MNMGFKEPEDLRGQGKSQQCTTGAVDTGRDNARPSPDEGLRPELGGGPGVQAAHVRGQRSTDGETAHTVAYDQRGFAYFRYSIQLVEAEIKSAESSHGVLTPSLGRALNLIGEEFGELAKAINDYTRSHQRQDGVLNARLALAGEADLLCVIDEAKQLAALSIMLIQNITIGKVDR